MATEENGKLRGTVGGRIYSIDPVTHQQIVRSCPRKVRNPKTAAQQAHRSAFVDIVRLSSHMTEAHSIGLQRHAWRAQQRTYAYFRRLNKDCFTSDGAIDYPRIILSIGSVPVVKVTSARLGADFTLSVTFDDGLIQPSAAPDDQVYLFAYCPAAAAGLLAPPVLRTAGAVTLPLPADWRPADADLPQVHPYAFLRNRGGKTSCTIYIPLTV